MSTIHQTRKNISIETAVESPTQVSATGPSLQVGTLRIVGLLLAIAASLLIINLAAIYLNSVMGFNNSPVRALVYYFDAAKEQSIPTLFSSLLLFIATILLTCIFFIRRIRSRETSGWLILSFVFLFLMVDEATGIHEQLNSLRKYINDDSGYLYYAWVVPYALLVLVFGAVMMKFLFRLPVRIRNMMILAGIVYVSAAIGFELFEGLSTKQLGAGNLRDKFLTAFEEFFEMIGVIIFIHALFRYMAAFNLSISIAPKKAVN